MISNPIYDPYLILTKVYSEGAHVKQAIADTYIEELYRSRTVRIVYGVLENDGYLSYCIKHYAPKAPKLAVRTILKISLYMILFMEKSRYMVTDNAVELCKKLGKSGVSGFVNAFLRKFNGEEISLPAGDEGLAVKYSFPLFAVKKIKAAYGDRAKSILSASSKGVTVRFERNEEKYLDKEHVDTPFPHVYIFKNFVREEGFFAGDYTFQSVGSVAICALVPSCDNLLDACAAPGGKSVLLAKRCQKVVSTELHEHRVSLITQYKQRMGKENVTEMQADATVERSEFFEAFDGVLCDVPCSGFGTFAENPDIKLKGDTLFELNKTQRAILENCRKYVKRGGTLTYSTCSLFREENDDIVGQFLKKHNDFERVEIESPLDHLKTEYGLQFLPDTAYGAGFYVAQLRKK